MRPRTLRFVAFLTASAAALAITVAAPAGVAQADPAPQGLGALLSTLVDGMRGVAPAAPPTAPATVTPPTAATVPAPPSASVPAAPVSAPPGPASPMAVEAQLAALRYFVGPVDGVIDSVSSSAIMAFQKVNGMERTGELSGPVADAILAASGTPGALVPNGDSNKVEIDLTRQVLFLYEGGQLTTILPVSSGTSATPTPTGSYKIYRRVVGWETSPLGRLYNSQYFVGGYAIHGSLSVPATPASHGCVRITMAAADFLPDHIGFGTPVYVVGR